MIIIHASLNESELVRECLNGKHASQERLYGLYAPRMLGVCYRYASSHEEAEDFLQEAFIAIFRKLHQYKGDGPLGAWIRKIVVNTSLNCIKARHPFTETENLIPIDQMPDNTVLEEPQNGVELMELIHQLPVGYKTVFNLHAIEGYSHEEIATMLGIKSGTSRSQFMRARQMLIQKITPELRRKQNSSYNG